MSTTAAVVVCIFFVFFAAMSIVAIAKTVREQLEELEERYLKHIANLAARVAELEKDLETLHEKINDLPEIATDSNVTRELAERIEKRWESAIEGIMNFDPLRGDTE